MIRNAPPFFKVRLTNLIKSDGVFIGLDIDDLIIKFASENFFNIFNYEIIEKSAGLLLSQNSIIKLLNYASNKRIKSVDSKIISNLELKFDNQVYNTPCNIFFSENILCIEFSSQIKGVPFLFDDLYYQEMLNYVKNYAGSLKELMNFMCKYISEVTGFERTVYCDFLPNESACIKASYSNGLESLLNHHFPNSDVSTIVITETYIKNRFRMISNIDYKQVAIQGYKDALDFTYSFYKDIHPLRMQYLKKMDLISSASFSVVLDEKLQGVFAAQSKSKKFIPLTILEKIQNLVEEYSRKLLLFKFKKFKNRQIKFNNKLEGFIQNFKKVDCVLEKVSNEEFNVLNEVFNTDYVFYRYKNKFEKNMQLPIELAECILEFANNNSQKNLILTDNLSKQNSKFEKWAKDYAAGMILIKLNEECSSFIVLLRKEIIQSIKWGGIHSEKDVHQNCTFKTWYQEVLNKCPPWSIIENDSALYLQNKLFTIQSNNLIKLKYLNESLNNRIYQKELLFSKIHQSIKNTYSIINTIFSLSVFKQSKIEENIKNIFLNENKTIPINVKYYFENISEKIVYLVKENFYQNIKINLEIEKNSVFSLNKLLSIGLIFHEFILLSIKHSLPPSQNYVFSIHWHEKEDNIYFTLNESEHIKFDSQINVDFDLIRFLINQLNSTGLWNKKNGLTLKIVLQNNKSHIKYQKLLI